MNKLFLSLSTVAVLITATGCTTTAGNQSLAKESAVDFKAKVVEGKTTRSEVIAMYGLPMSKNYDNGNEVAHYAFSKLTPNATNYIPVVNWFVRGATGFTRSMTIVYDDAGVVKKATLDDSALGVKSGVQ